MMMIPKRATPGLRWKFMKRNDDKKLQNIYLTGIIEFGSTCLESRWLNGHVLFHLPTRLPHVGVDHFFLFQSLFHLKRVKDI